MLSRIRDNSLFYYAIVAAIILISWLIIRHAISTEKVFNLDTGQYIYLAQTINANRLTAFTDPLRTYGYPLFLSLVLRTHPAADRAQAIDLIVVAQFSIHTLNSFISVSILKRFIMPRLISPFLGLFGFALVQLNAILLGLTHDVLTDSLTVFLITLFFWVAISRFRTKWLLLSALLAITIVVRPFHQTWGAAYAVLMLAIYFLRLAAQSGWNPLTIIRTFLAKIRLKHIPITTLFMIIPFILIVGLQYSFTYRDEGIISIVGRDANKFINLHLQETLYAYKYETYVGPEDRSVGIYYIAENQKEAIEKNDQNLIQSILHRPIETIAVMVVKLIGLFQHYEWSTYRQTSMNTPNIVFWWGLIPTTVLLYISQQLILRWNWKIASINFNPVVIILSGTLLYLLMYAAATIPEHRFAAPTIPVLTMYGLAAASDRSNWRMLILALVTGCLLYFITY